jgi:glycolate oxidase
MIGKPWLKDLEDIVGKDAVLSHPDDLLTYQYDGSIFQRAPSAVALPSSSGQVSAIVKLAGRSGLRIVARGAGTGLCGGVIPVEDAIMIGFSRMKKILEIDFPNRTALVEPGVVNMDLTGAVEKDRYFYAPDPSSQKACTLGGNVALNSGGPHCLAYGVTSNHVLGLEVVLEDGRVCFLGGKSERAGYDMVGAWVGSEGTFGIITKILLKLTPRPEATHTILVIFNEIEQACEAVSSIIAAGIVPAALEIMDQVTIQAVEAAIHFGFPKTAGAVLLAELDGFRENIKVESAALMERCLQAGAKDMSIADTPEDRERLWAGRKAALGALGRLAPNYYIQDGVVPRSKLAQTLRRVRQVGEKYGLTIANVFHAGDGNLHPNMVFDARVPGQLERVVKAGAEILKACVEAGGTLSGEHGIGLEKSEYMPWVFSESDMAAMKRLRGVFSPNGLFNPGKVFPTGKSCGELIAQKSHPALGQDSFI